MSDTNDTPLTGGVVLVTGAGRGLGREIALTFARSGADVVVAARTAAQIEELAAEIGTLGRRARPIVADVAQEDQVRAMVAQALAEFGQVDVLINNAGVAVYGPFVEQNSADWRAMIHTNLMGTIFCTHAVLPHMLARGQGLVINISSVAGIHGLPNEAIYCASKHGVRGFTDALAVELKEKGVRVCGIYPGGMDTPFWDVQTYGGDRSRIMDPARVAEMVLAVARQPAGILVREVILFPTNEWH
ncbi:MAG: SDR family oxidoreductase [Chloroflexi bacterium]|nr:SDR family oxidoreductase [Chloroflexota bacterium]